MVPFTKDPRYIYISGTNIQVKILLNNSVIIAFKFLILSNKIGKLRLQFQIR